MIRIEDAAWPKRRLVRFFLDLARRVERRRLAGQPVPPGERLLHAAGPACSSTARSGTTSA